jgi:hypothetical protein
MFKKTTILRVAAAVALAASALTAQAADNPLHPTYFWSKVSMPEIKGSGERYVNANNPREPGFYGAGVYQGAAYVEPYVDSRNPLHPSFRTF